MLRATVCRTRSKVDDKQTSYGLLQLLLQLLLRNIFYSYSCMYFTYVAFIVLFSGGMCLAALILKMYLADLGKVWLVSGGRVEKLGCLRCVVGQADFNVFG